MKLSFHGCDQYDFEDRYNFSDKFEQWWEKELRKRIPDSKEFAQKHGKGWGLSVTFRAPKGKRKPNLEGPFDDRYLKSWYIELPSFRYMSPEPKAYVPLLRQFLAQLAILLEREQIDATKLRKDSPLLLKRFASQRGMLEYDDLQDFIAAEAKKERDQASDCGRSLKADTIISERLRNLRRKYELKFGVAFDATAKQRRGTGWRTDYAVVDLTVVLPSKKGEIPDDLHQEAMQIFRRAEAILDRNRTFFFLRIVPRLKKEAWSWSVALLLNNRDLAVTHALVRKTAAELLPALIGNAPFRAQYSNAMQALCLYSHRDQNVYAIPSEAAITLSDHYRDSDGVEQSLLSGKCGENIICWSGVYLGNLYYFLKRHREAIPHWQQAAANGEPEALMCIGSAYATLGDMKKAFQYCKRALQHGVPRKLLDDDPDFAEFRRHPLFSKLKETKKKAPAPPAKPLSPKWTMPKNLEELVEQNDGLWDDDRWKPILLTVMSDTSSGSRKIRLSWQLEFDPYAKPFKAAGKRLLEANGVEPDGDAWTNLIQREFAKHYPGLVDELDSDSETSTCVMQVQSEETCRKLLELIWSRVHGGIGRRN
jgi:hypothetical protein